MIEGNIKEEDFNYILEILSLSPGKPFLIFQKS